LCLHPAGRILTNPGCDVVRVARRRLIKWESTEFSTGFVDKCESRLAARD
jgi:hypothetical protein